MCLSDDLIGETMIPLSTIVGQKSAPKWYTIYRESRITGEVLLAMKLPRPPGYVPPHEDVHQVHGEDGAGNAAAGALGNTYIRIRMYMYYIRVHPTGRL